MKNGLLILSVVLTIAVGYLLYTQFSSGKNRDKTTQVAIKDPTPNNSSFLIAYFEMDSVEVNFEMVKDVKAELSKKEDVINSELNKMDKSYREKMNDYQQKAQSMTQVQSESATQDLMKTQDQMKNRKQVLDQEYNDLVLRKQNEMKSKIENYLKDYNKTRKYSYIFSSDPGIIYYKDTAYNITPDLIRGLNELYKHKNQ